MRTPQAQAATAKRNAVCIGYGATRITDHAVVGKALRVPSGGDDGKLDLGFERTKPRTDEEVFKGRNR